MPRRSISVHVLTAGQECARLGRLPVLSALSVYRQEYKPQSQVQRRDGVDIFNRNVTHLRSVRPNRNRHLGDDRKDSEAGGTSSL